MQRSMISAALAAVSLRDLALVQAVAQAGSFNSAARSMHISPSGLSHQVQKVEQALGTPLFERGGRRVSTTAGGQRLLAQIAVVLAAAEHLQVLARAGGVAFGGELRLGVPASLGPYLLPHLIAPFPQRFAGAHLTLSEGKPRGLLRRLHESELDAVLAPRMDVPSGIAAQALFFEPWVLMLRSDHALARRRVIGIGQIDPAAALVMAESPGEGTGAAQDVSLESLAALLRLRGGYAWVPALARARLSSMPGVVLLPIRGAAPGREIVLYWRDSTPWQDDMHALAALLRELAASLRVLRVDTSPAAS